MQHLIYSAISKKLNAESGGSCTYDPGCIYGFGVKQCSANKEVLEEKLDEFKREWRTEDPDHKGCIIGCSRDMAAWPCSMFKIVSFSEPEREAKTLEAEI
jgi:hypothetical protein